MNALATHVGDGRWVVETPRPVAEVDKVVTVPSPSMMSVAGTGPMQPMAAVWPQDGAWVAPFPGSAPGIVTWQGVGAPFMQVPSEPWFEGAGELAEVPEADDHGGCGTNEAFEAAYLAAAAEASARGVIEPGERREALIDALMEEAAQAERAKFEATDHMMNSRLTTRWCVYVSCLTFSRCRMMLTGVAIAPLLFGATGCPFLGEHYGDEPLDEFLTSRGAFFESRASCKDGSYCSPGIVTCVHQALWITRQISHHADDIVEGFVPGAPCERLSGTSGNETDSPCDVFRSVFCAEYSLLDTPGDSVDLMVESSASISACMEFFGSMKGWWIHDCGMSVDAGSSMSECEIFRESMRRLDECIQKRGPQDFPDGQCFLPFLAPLDGSGNDEISTEYCDECPWWSSETCFEFSLQMYLERGG